MDLGAPLATPAHRSSPACCVIGQTVAALRLDAPCTLPYNLAPLSTVAAAATATASERD